MQMRTVARVGESFVNDIRMTWYGRPILNVIDAFAGGHGITKVGRSATVGDEIDQGANLFLWAEAVFVPSAFRSGSSARTDQLASDQIRLTVPFGSSHDEATVHFANGHPSRFSARRHKGVGTSKIWWHVDYSDWYLSEEIWVPRHLEVKWEDEPRPWLSLEVDGFAANVEVDRRLQEVAALIQRARVGSSHPPGIHHRNGA